MRILDGQQPTPRSVMLFLGKRMPARNKLRPVHLQHVYTGPRRGFMPCGRGMPAPDMWLAASDIGLVRVRKFKVRRLLD